MPAVMPEIPTPSRALRAGAKAIRAIAAASSISAPSGSRPPAAPIAPNTIAVRATRSRPGLTKPQQVIAMRPSTKLLALFGTIGLLILAKAAWAQDAVPGFSAPPRAAPTRAAPVPRAASCHNGASFDRFLADLKQQALAAGVSQRAISEASPYLVYDQGIVNRDRGQRVFGQVFTVFAGRMAAVS